MASFLYDTANMLVANYGDEALTFNYIFPNRRSALFFRRYLGKAVGHPFLSPEMLTIDELFQQLAKELPTPLKKVDSLSLQFMLYEEYKKIAHSPSSIDDFLYWGKIILADFNEIDVSMVDAKDILSNIKALHDIDKAMMSGPEQAFKDFWDELLPLYENIRARLLSQNVAYSGMLQRAVVEQLSSVHHVLTQQRPYIFIGLNAISKAEEALLLYLRDHCNADFYWDYSSALLLDNKTASLFLKHNTETFPSKLPCPVPCSVPFSGEIELISVPSDIGQTLVASTLLEQHYTHSPHNEPTWAIVLPEEQMLLPMMNAIPDAVSTVNITMGYPLRLSQIHSFVATILSMLKHSIVRDATVLYQHTEVLELLSHPYLRREYGEQCTELSALINKTNRVYIEDTLLQPFVILGDIIVYNNRLKIAVHDSQASIPTVPVQLLSDICDKVKVANATEQEQILRYSRLLQQIHALWQQYADSVKEVSISLFTTILNNLVSSATIPFEGEPLGGLQLMGVLETRALSFDNIIILSVNDDVFPQASSAQSFIPYSVRRHFQMATREKQDAISAYNFYRLISHAQHIWLVHNSDNSGQKSGEVSRFLRQLDYQFAIPIRQRTVSSTLFSKNSDTLRLAKRDIVYQKLQEYLCPTNPYTHHARGLSPSALKTYCKCPLQFALHYILSFKPNDEVVDDIQDNIFGDVAHALLEELYKPFIDRDVTATALKDLLTNLPVTFPRLLPIVDQKKLVDPIAEKALYSYVSAILHFDMNNAPFHYVGSEVERETILTLPDSTKIKLQGKIDRIDKRADRLRVIDYKTGAEPQSPPRKMDAVFTRDNYVIQTLFYCALLEDDATLTMQPHIYYFREISKDSHYDTAVPWESETGVLDYTQEVREQFHAALQTCLTEMLNQEQDFVANPKVNHCKYCQYNKICRTA